MKILIASIPATGHLNPLLSIASLLVESGHEVAVQVNEDLRPAVEAAGHRFLSEIPNPQTSAGYYFETYPERTQKSPGMEMTGYDLIHFFARNIAAQSASLKMALYDFQADLILADSLYWGTLPMLVGPRDMRPAIAHLGISVVNIGSGKNIPMRPDETPEQRDAELQLRERLMLQPAQQAVNAALASLGYPALPCPILEAMTALPDLYLHPGIESFEYPDSNSKVRYIGALPTPAGQPTLPEWWQHLDRTKRIVLVTQGTIANRDFGQVIAPALVALGGREDVTIIVTTGGQPVESIPVPIPSNARIASFLPYAQIMPEIDLLITNGGYGTVNMAISHGIPVISAGLTEDKEEVSAHVQWSGAGIDLRANQATPEAIRHAVDEIFTQPGYRERAQQHSVEFASHGVEVELLSLIEECVRDTVSA
ncbi:MAG TPA: nucleotide disphospho-sugar-binding domain-containing protein [Edaphobacter sp.]|nr:nucleotide disphospho-sugar-binding domain-containing protein [Edaphobacter sp.]